MRQWEPPWLTGGVREMSSSKRWLNWQSTARRPFYSKKVGSGPLEDRPPTGAPHGPWSRILAVTGSIILDEEFWLPGDGGGRRFGVGD